MLETVTAFTLVLVTKTDKGELVELRGTVPNWTGFGNTVTGTAARAMVPLTAKQAKNRTVVSFGLIKSISIRGFPLRAHTGGWKCTHNREESLWIFVRKVGRTRTNTIGKKARWARLFGFNSLIDQLFTVMRVLR
jgi:hypothetical protein